ncbi:hypothetical protein M378DRAFT_163137 [Amanita muscaria Koide BX008]|uniref:Uncharacterized protein n=1 Tax=Amanita muscaria (strain Koide BX008) TaxID=946122 RepID=A0A0C2X555_AMAMK|nr:hypothetical protein M378DRAFT_163137 [Amanita muscaria Koide BX008]
MTKVNALTILDSPLTRVSEQNPLHAVSATISRTSTKVRYVKRFQRSFDCCITIVIFSKGRPRATGITSPAAATWLWTHGITDQTRAHYILLEHRKRDRE